LNRFELPIRSVLPMLPIGKSWNLFGRLGYYSIAELHELVFPLTGCLPRWMSLDDSAVRPTTKRPATRLAFLLR
jgi:hypothetical protein